MPVSIVIRSVTIEDRVLEARAAVWKCDGCGIKSAFDDRTDDHNRRESEGEPQRRGWRLSWRGDDQECFCSTSCEMQSSPSRRAQPAES